MNSNVNVAPEITNARLVRWVALSLALHLALLAPWPFAPRLTGQHETVLSVSLVPDRSLSRPTRFITHYKSIPAEILHAHNARPLLERTDTAFVRAEQAISSRSLPTTTAEIGDVSDGSSLDSGASQARIRALLLADLARHFDYPLVARARGWQGTVLLGLRVESDGHLDQVHIENSSGYAVLDRSALNSVNRLGYLTEAVAWLNGRSHDIQLPVIYRLVEN
jgi:protein TonB